MHGGHPVALPSILSAVAASSSASSPTVADAVPVQLLGRHGPPHPTTVRPAGEAGTPSSRSGSTTSSPSGLLTALATLGEELGAREPPTEIASPASVRTRSRNSVPRSARAYRRCVADHRLRGTPRRSRAPRRAGWCRGKIANTVFARGGSTRPWRRLGTTTASGQSSRACRPPMAVRTPRAPSPHSSRRAPTPPPLR